MPTDSEAVGGMLAEVSGAAAEIDRAEVSLFKYAPQQVPPAVLDAYGITAKSHTRLVCSVL